MPVSLKRLLLVVHVPVVLNSFPSPAAYSLPGVLQLLSHQLSAVQELGKGWVGYPSSSSSPSHRTLGDDVGDNGGRVGDGGQGDTNDGLQGLVFEVQHAPPKAIGSTLHHGHGDRVHQRGRVDGVGRHEEGVSERGFGKRKLEQPVREAAEELHVVVVLVKDGSCLAREVAQGVHETLLVLLGGQDLEYHVQDGPVQAVLELGHRHHGGLPLGLLQEVEEQRVHAHRRLVVRPLPDLVHHLGTEQDHPAQGVGDLEPGHSILLEQNQDVLVSRGQGVWPHRT